jgi:hypothetical protein
MVCLFTAFGLQSEKERRRFGCLNHVSDRRHLKALSNRISERVRISPPIKTALLCRNSFQKQNKNKKTLVILKRKISTPHKNATFFPTKSFNLIQHRTQIKDRQKSNLRIVWNVRLDCLWKQNNHVVCLRPFEVPTMFYILQTNRFVSLITTVKRSVNATGCVVLTRRRHVNKRLESKTGNKRPSNRIVLILLCF